MHIIMRHIFRILSFVIENRKSKAFSTFPVVHLGVGRRDFYVVFAILRVINVIRNRVKRLKNIGSEKKIFRLKNVKEAYQAELGQ